MYDEQLLARIREYLRQNQGRFTFEALRQKLIAEGVEPAAIDVAAAQLRSEGQPVYGTPPYGAPLPQPSKRKAHLGRVLLVAAGVVLLNFVVGALGFWAILASGIPFLLEILAPLLLAAEIAGAIIYFKKNLNVSVGLMVAIVATPVVAFALLLGACLLLIAGEGRIGG
jgi:hypothetical protein